MWEDILILEKAIKITPSLRIVLTHVAFRDTFQNTSIHRANAGSATFQIPLAIWIYISQDQIWYLLTMLIVSTEASWWNMILFQKYTQHSWLLCFTMINPGTRVSFVSQMSQFQTCPKINNCETLETKRYVCFSGATYVDFSRNHYTKWCL